MLKIVLPLVLSLVSFWLLRRLRPRRQRTGARKWLVVAALVVLPLLAVGGWTVGGWFLWMNHLRRPPPPDTRELFRGITYVREVRQHPRLMVIHVVRIDLRTPGLRFLVTPPDESPTTSTTNPAKYPKLTTRARTTSDFLREFHVQLAVNGSFFHKFHSQSPLDFYPRSGDPVHVLGIAASNGVPYAPKWNPGTLYLSKDNQASFDEPIGEVYNAISGYGYLRKDGVYQGPFDGSEGPEPRNVIALDRERRHLLLFVVDGRQPNYSEGAGLSELMEVIHAHGGHTAVWLDGGGSSTLVMETPSGRARVLNSPIHTRLPGRERPVANHLGVYVEK